MYDYLRKRERARSESLHVPAYAAANSNTPNETAEPYRDEPFIVIIEDGGEDDGTQPPPPSYNELYRQNEIEMETLMREFEIDGTPAEQSEELFKWVVAMLLVGLTVACVGTVSLRARLVA